MVSHLDWCVSRWPPAVTRARACRDEAEPLIHPQAQLFYDMDASGAFADFTIAPSGASTWFESKRMVACLCNFHPTLSKDGSDVDLLSCCVWGDLGVMCWRVHANIF
jgi:hypothetical protein